MVKSIKRNLVVKKKNNKLQYILTIEQLLKSGFHFGDEDILVRKEMSPFIVGKSKARSRYKNLITKNTYPNINSFNRLSKKLRKVQKKGITKVITKSIQQKDFSELLTQMKSFKLKN